MPPFVLVAGARPNFMKIAPLARALERHPSRPAYEIVHTGQHYDFEMSGVFFEQLGLREPDVYLEVGSASHGAQTGRIMEAFERYLLDRGPVRGIVVVGDVNSTMAAALVGAKLGIPVAHVEAGLRSFDRTMPEEINRIVTDSISDVLLVSEPAGLQNLAAEGIDPRRVSYVGNVMIDTLFAHRSQAAAREIPRKHALTPGAYVLVTLHRPANIDSSARLSALVGFLIELSAVLPVVFPVHPRTAKQLGDSDMCSVLAAESRILLLPAQGYHEFLGLLDAAAVAVTDSGGIQEESTILGIPCVTLRASTERPVTVSRGTNVLVGDDLGRALQHVRAAVSRGRASPPAIDGWDGHAAERIVDVLVRSVVSEAP